MPADDAEATMPEVGGATTQQPQNGREARNLAEKHRRDKLNASIQELATMVPHVAESTRRLDKTAVLRFAAHGLRLQYVFGKTANKNHSRQQQQFDHQQPLMTDALMELLDSFFLTLTCHGQIVLISANVEQLLGHCQPDLYGQNILQITHAEDQALMRQQLIPRDMETLFNTEYQQNQQAITTLTTTAEADTDDDADDDDDDIDGRMGNEEHEHVAGDTNAYYRTSNTRSQAQHFAEIDARLRMDRRCFTVRLARAGTRSEATRSYEIVKIDGCFRRSDFSTNAGTFPIVSQLIRRSRNNAGNSGSLAGAHLLQHDAIAQAALHGISGNDIVLVAVARIIRPPKIINRLLEPNRLEYRTRHLLDGCIIDCDQRISLVAGYMKNEVRNLSPFSFIHQDDVRWVVVALRQMYDLSDCGESCYRLLSRSGNFIYLQTRGYFEIDKSTNTAKSFVCINTLLDEEEGKRKVQEMKTKFSIIIQTKIPSNSQQDVPASQNPQQLERIVKYLIENLEKRNEVVGAGGTSSAGRALTSHAAATAGGSMLEQVSPIALVPPEPASVSRSISKSVKVINVTGGKNLIQQQQQCLKSPASLHGSSETSLSPASSSDHMDEQFDGSSNTSPNSQLNAMAMVRPSVLHLSKLSSTTGNSSKQKLSKANTSSCSSSSGGSSSNSFDANNRVTLLANSPTADSTSIMQQQVSVLKRLHSTAMTQSEECLVAAAKRSQLDVGTLSSSNAEIHTVITASLQSLDDTLQDISNQTQTLYEQCFASPVPVPSCIEEQLDAISVEQRMQQQELVHIKTEYDVHVLQQQQQQLELSEHATDNVKISANNATNCTSELQPND